MTEEGRAVAWVEVGERHDVGLFGAPDDLRELAAIASAAADQADDMQRIADQLRAIGRRGARGGLMTVARSRRDHRDEELVGLVTGVAGSLWRCRLELALVAALLSTTVLLSGLVGAVVAGVVSAAVAAVVLAVPAVRQLLLRSLRAARVRRAWWRAWTDCELPRVRAGRVTTIPAGELVRVRASRGSSLEHVEQRAEELAVCLQAREVRVGPRSGQRRDRDGDAGAP